MYVCMYDVCMYIQTACQNPSSEDSLVPPFFKYLLCLINLSKTFRKGKKLAGTKKKRRGLLRVVDANSSHTVSGVKGFSLEHRL